jgi:hypothetical protein
VTAKILRKFVPARFRPSTYLENLVYERTDARVYRGPFMGMRWISSPGANGRIHIPKLLGIYERELNRYIERACALDFSLIVDVGAAEGYYAVGMARRNPKARIIAFEMEAKERSALAEAAELNDVKHRIEIRGKCEPQDLEAILSDTPQSLVICDTEGYEFVLLDLTAVPSLARAFILVELHEFIERGITEKIRTRFAATHKITQIWQEKRTVTDFPFRTFYTRCLPQSYLHWAVNESRPERMSWFWMEPHRIDEAA